MTDHKNVTIAMLVLSAVVLSVLLVAAFRTAPPAYAGNTSARIDPYIMMPGGRSDSADNLYVVDVFRQRINVYYADRNRKALILKDSKELAGLFQR